MKNKFVRINIISFPIIGLIATDKLTVRLFETVN
jgi:hypothetical protein